MLVRGPEAAERRRAAALRQLPVRLRGQQAAGQVEHHAGHLEHRHAGEGHALLDGGLPQRQPARLRAPHAHPHPRRLDRRRVPAARLHRREPPRDAPGEGPDPREDLQPRHLRAGHGVRVPRLAALQRHAAGRQRASSSGARASATTPARCRTTRCSRSASPPSTPTRRRSPAARPTRRTTTGTCPSRVCAPTSASTRRASSWSRATASTPPTRRRCSASTTSASRTPPSCGRRRRRSSALAREAIFAKTFQCAQATGVPIAQRIGVARRSVAAIALAELVFFVEHHDAALVANLPVPSRVFDADHLVLHTTALRQLDVIRAARGCDDTGATRREPPRHRRLLRHEPGRRSCASGCAGRAPTPRRSASAWTSSRAS